MTLRRCLAHRQGAHSTLAAGAYVLISSGRGENIWMSAMQT